VAIFAGHPERRARLEPAAQPAQAPPPEPVAVA
jgi:hypothetical protein